ncbi:MerR family transcriptional regulator [Deinococcus pimensis]|uniref:MerR family transcriptional regulator n=1 Tax=Deinococcus pimensis TaxID=309888 RepID=UPI000483B746|nr:MerR family transcriptional regulator [Deinococcus pimensis]
MSEHHHTWRIGELARQTGLTVRTLHHYDRCGLLTPTTRTSGGHRCYTHDDVLRLQRIITLRSCGLTLEDIREVLLEDTDGDLTARLHRQLKVVTERARQALVLRDRLLGILDALQRTSEPPVTELLRLIEDTTAMSQPWTPEELTRLKTTRSRATQEMSSEAFTTLREQRRQVWAALRPGERTFMVESRRATLSTQEDTER